MGGNMKEMIIKSLNGKLKDNVKASDIAIDIIDNLGTKKDKYVATKFKISEENAEIELQNMLNTFEISELSVKEAKEILNKIRWGRLFLENEKLAYHLSSQIDVGNGLTKKFFIDRPLQVAFDDNDVDILAIASLLENGRDLEKGTITKVATIFLGIPVDFGKNLSIGDTMTIFSIGMLFFFD